MNPQDNELLKQHHIQHPNFKKIILKFKELADLGVEFKSPIQCKINGNYYLVKNLGKRNQEVLLDSKHIIQNSSTVISSTEEKNKSAKNRKSIRSHDMFIPATSTKSAASPSFGKDLSRKAFFDRLNDSRALNHSANPSKSSLNRPKYLKSYTDFKNFLDEIVNNSKQGNMYCHRIPYVSAGSISSLFQKHWKYFDLLFVSDDFKSSFDFFLSLACLGSDYDSHKRQFYQIMNQEYLLVRDNPLGHPVPSATPEVYLSWIKGAWMICQHVGPALFQNCSSPFPLTIFFEISRNLGTLEDFLNENSYTKKFTYSDWFFTKN